MTKAALFIQDRGSDTTQLLGPLAVSLMIFFRYVRGGGFRHGSKSDFLSVTLNRAIVDQSKFNRAVQLPYQLRLADFELAMQDVHDFLYDVNGLLLQRGLHRMDDMLRPAAMSGIKSTRKKGGAVDTHGARDQWMCVFVYETDHLTEPAINRAPMRFTEVYIAQVVQATFAIIRVAILAHARQPLIARGFRNYAPIGSILLIVSAASFGIAFRAIAT